MGICRLAATLAVSGMLAACASDVDRSSDINFERMSPVELAEYNNGRPLDQMIVCTEETRTTSRVRRKRCVTVEQAYGSYSEVQKINALNAAGFTVE